MAIFNSYVKLPEGNHHQSSKSINVYLPSRTCCTFGKHIMQLQDLPTGHVSSWLVTQVMTIL